MAPDTYHDFLEGFLNFYIVAATPVSVQQATLVQLGNQPTTMAVAPPTSALPGHGGLQLNLRSRLYDGLPAVQAWFQRYPYSCLEQQASKAIGLHDAVMWREILEKIPTYLDDQGLADYFPLRGGSDSGSPLLTAWLLSATHEASRLDAAFALPRATREQMIRGLTMFVEGKLLMRYFIVGYTTFTEIVKFLFSEGYSFFSFDPSHYFFTVFLAWYSNNLSIHYTFIRVEEVLYFFRRNVLTSANNQIFDTT